VNPPAVIKLEHGGGLQRPRRIVIHAMAEYISADAKTARAYGRQPGSYHALQWLDVIKLSAHALVAPNGAIIRCRDDGQVAWHARGYNADSLGVEFLVPGIHNYTTFLKAMQGDYLPNAAYDAGVELVQSWVDHHDITEIVTHAEIDPNRKKDPGAGFPLNQFMGDIKQ